MKERIFLFNLIFVLMLSLFLNADDTKKRTFIDVKKDEYIIGDIPLNFLHKKLDSEKYPFKEYLLRNFNLEYNYSIFKSPIDGDSPLVISKEKYNEYIENFRKDKDPYKYLYRDKKEYKVYATFKEASNYCKKSGGRIQKDFELEIALKYYNASPGRRINDNKNKELNAYVEYAYDKENNPILIKYYWGRIENYKSFLIFFDDKIKIDEDSALAADIRCVVENKNVEK